MLLHSGLQCFLNMLLLPYLVVFIEYVHPQLFSSFADLTLRVVGFTDKFKSL